MCVRVVVCMLCVSAVGVVCGCVCACVCGCVRVCVCVPQQFTVSLLCAWVHSVQGACVRVLWALRVRVR